MFPIVDLFSKTWNLKMAIFTLKIHTKSTIKLFLMTCELNPKSS